MIALTIFDKGTPPLHGNADAIHRVPTALCRGRGGFNYSRYFYSVGVGISRFFM